MYLDTETVYLSISFRREIEAFHNIAVPPYLLNMIYLKIFFPYQNIYTYFKGYKVNHCKEVM